ncbi:hypothetical protein HMPREF0970_01432 [Schaalia odontolytica F0309]|nr:hypothetical protein HMPREF0970_01430 [Schaalia odontolytica F0309]EFF79639.1 hypothetical protein HMPREF0970_01432 [Schaalia odontolytica F0309]
MSTGSTSSQGSSPLTRGKRGSSCGARHWRGLIPAHAGKTVPERAGVEGDEAHPRSRGENWSMISPSESVSGSSPLTRGKRNRGRHRGRRARLIPAHAGKTNE